MSDKILNVLKSLDKLIPLYWIEKLSLFNKDVFIFIYEGMNKLNEVSDCLNKINSGNLSVDLFVPKKNKDDKYDYTVFYSIALIQDASYSTSLPYLYALISTPDVCIPQTEEDEIKMLNFHRYMRLIRNLIININQIDVNNITNIFAGIDSIVSTIKDINFYKNFKNFVFDSKGKFKSYDVAQLEEETNKLKKIMENNGNPEVVSEIESEIFKTEQSNFLTGAISFLYLENKEGKVNWDNFNIKYDKFREYFEKGGIKEKYKDKIMTAFLKQWEFSFESYIFSTSAETWKKILTNKKYATIINSILVEDFEKLLDKNRNYVLIDGLNDHQKKIQKRFKDLLKDEYFVHFINNNPKLNNGRFVDAYGGCFYQYRASKGVILFGLPKRDKLLTEYFNKNLIEFSSESEINKKNAEYYKSVTGFFYHWDWDLQFYCRSTKKVYSWDYDNKIYKKMNDTNNWEEIKLDDLKKEIK